MKKIEIIIESTYTNRLLELLEKNTITAYTLIKGVQGCGGHGLKSSDDVTDVFSNNYIFTVCTQDKFFAIKDEIKSFIKMYGGKCIVSDAEIFI